MRKVYVGIDNGVSGSIGIVCTESGVVGPELTKPPTFSQQDYVKTKRNITRIDHRKLHRQLKQMMQEAGKMMCDDFLVLIERPMINPMRFRATVSACRALEATLIAIERLKLPYQYIDSKEWQSALLPHVKATTKTGKKNAGRNKQTKELSRQVGLRLFPTLERQISRHGDADGLLIAEHARRKQL